MGWKTDTVLIRPAALREAPQTLLGELGFAGLAAIGERPYEQAIWPEKGTVWIGDAGDCLMISARGLSDRFFRPQPAPLVQALFQRFPGSEIAAVTLHSVVNLWGFAVFREGKPVRRKAGSADDGTFDDFGAPLPEEEAHLARSRLDADGKRLYRLPEFPDEDFAEDQVGEEYVFKVYERFAGQRPDTGATLLETRGEAFRYAAIGASGRPRWRFWR